MILLSDLSFRMKDNARTFFMVAIISTVAFSAIGTLFGFQSYITGGVKKANPYSFTYDENYEQTAEEIERHMDRVNHLLAEKEIEAGQVTAELRYYLTEDGQVRLIASESIYNDFANILGREKIDLENNEIVGVRQSAAMIAGFIDYEFIDQPIELKNSQQLKLTEIIDGDVLPERIPHYIVSDQTYQQLPEPSRTNGFTAWNVIDGQEEVIIEAGELLTTELNKPRANYFQAMDYMIYTINQSYGPILFIGLFIGIVFFVSAGSFLYFRLFTDLDQDKEKFRSIAKMGLTVKELKKVITRQTALLFFAPIVVALIHGAVALTALSHFFNYGLVKESTMVLGSFFVIQIIYYLIVRFAYIREIKSSLLS